MDDEAIFFWPDYKDKEVKKYFKKRMMFPWLLRVMVLILLAVIAVPAILYGKPILILYGVPVIILVFLYSIRDHPTIEIKKDCLIITRFHLSPRAYLFPFVKSAVPWQKKTFLFSGIKQVVFHKKQKMISVTKHKEKPKSYATLFTSFPKAEKRFLKTLENISKKNDFEFKQWE